MDLPEDAVSISGEAEAAAAETAPAANVELETLAREKAELQDLLLRRQADHENFRRRMEKERIESAEYGAMDAVKAFLPVLDDFERAVGVECGDKEYARGMELIYQRTLDTLKKLGAANQKALVDLAKKMEPGFWTSSLKADEDSSKRLTEGGMTLVKVPPQMMADLSKKTAPMIAEFIKRVPASEKPIKAYLVEMKRA